MRIALDQDQVLAKWVEKVLHWYNEDYKTSFTVDDVNDYWAMEKFLGPQGKDFIRSCMRFPDFYHDLEPVEGAIEGVKTLINQGHDVVIVTAIPSSAPMALHGKLQWIRKHMPFFNHRKNLIVCSRKELIQADVLVDDAAHNVEAWVKAGKTGLLFDRPWNRESKIGARVIDWPDTLRALAELEQEKIEQQVAFEHGIYR